MDFETMVRRGLGRAVVYARENDVSMHRDYLLYACLHNLAYDKQAEEERSEHMTDIILETGNAEYYQHELVRILATARGGDEYDPQVYKILIRIAKPDDETIRSVLYTCIARDMVNGDYHPAEILVELDGLSGFLFALEQLESKEIDPDDEWRLEWLYKALEKKTGEYEAQVGLDAAIAAHPTYERYAEVIRAEGLPRKPMTPRTDASNYEEIARIIATATKSIYNRLTWVGKKADDETVRKIASDFLAEPDDSRSILYLRFFQKRAFPLAPDKLIELAESEDNQTAWLARWDLSHVAHPAVRELAFKILGQPGNPVKAIAMLKSNFQEGDWDIMFKTALRELSEDDYHRLEMDVRDLFEAHPLPQAKDALLALYDRGPCSLCRHAIVEHLQTLGPLPDWMIEECRYDAYVETRELADKILNG